MTLNSNTVQLHYYTDDKGLSNGWSLDYTTERVKCPPPGAVSKGRVTPTLDEYFYRDYIFVRCQTGYKLMMNGQEIKTYTAMCQNDEQWNLPLPECHIVDCGDPAPLLNGGVSFLSGELNQYGSVVQYHCDEPFYSLPGVKNVSFSCEADRKWRSVDGTGLILSCLPLCGKPRIDFAGFQRIIGGSAAPQGSIPWQVRLSGNGGGMIIADRWVLTAAHVLMSQNMQPKPHNTVKIFWGTNTRKEVPNAIAASVHLHPGYNNSDGLNFDNDIALIKLPESITFHSLVMPICLPSVGDSLQDGTVGVVSGFGLSGKDSKSAGLSNDLQYVRLPVVNPEKCSESLRGFPKVLKESHNMFCAGYPEGGQDSCQGDSGGPFALKSNDRYWAAGIVSFGLDCAREGAYGFYTRVSNYVDWVHKTMKEN